MEIQEKTVEGTPSDPESGFSPDVANKLRDRRAGHWVLDWDSLWRVLFPKDMAVPTGGKSLMQQSHLYRPNLSL